MIFVTQTSTGTMVKLVPQEQMSVIEATLLENQTDGQVNAYHLCARTCNSGL